MRPRKAKKQQEETSQRPATRVPRVPRPQFILDFGHETHRTPQGAGLSCVTIKLMKTGVIDKQPSQSCHLRGRFEETTLTLAPSS